MALAEYGNALNIDTDGSGNPILVDPDSGDTIAIYDRASGGWQVTEIEAATGDFDSVNTANTLTDPAGVEHTGELADASDVGGGGGGGNVKTASYVVETDGVEINAYANPSKSYTDLTGFSSIGDLLEEIIKNQLPPTGTDREAEGRVFLTQGEYPGNLSDYTNRSGTVLPIGFKLIGEGRMDPVEASTTNGQISNAEPLVTLYTADDGFVEPDVDTDAAIGPEVKNISLYGPGVGTAGSVGFNGNSGASNRWDWMDIENVSVWQFETAHDFRNSHHVRMKYCHFQQFTNAYACSTSNIRDKFWARDCQWFGDENNMEIEFGGKFVDVRGTAIGANPGSGNTAVTVTGGESVTIDGMYFNTLGNATAGTAFATRGQIDGGRVSGLVVTQQYDTAFSIGHNGEVDLLGLYDKSTASTSFEFVNSGDTANLQSFSAPNGVSIGAFDRVLFGEAEYTSSAPSGSNYSSSDAGTRIIDKSTTPPELYMVDETGGIIGPFEFGSGGGGSLTIDSFEDQDIAEYGGDTTAFGVDDTAPVFEGTYSLKASDSVAKNITSTTGLDNYPSAGDRFRGRWQFDNSSNRAMVWFGVQTEGSIADCYGFNVNGGSGEIALIKLEAGAQTTLDSATFTPAAGTEYQWDVDWGTNSTISCQVLDSSGSVVAGPISSTDVTFTSGGVGIHFSTAKDTTQKNVYDDLRIV